MLYEYAIRINIEYDKLRSGEIDRNQGDYNHVIGSRIPAFTNSFGWQFWYKLCEERWSDVYNFLYLCGPTYFDCDCMEVFFERTEMKVQWKTNNRNHISRNRNSSSKVFYDFA